MVVAFYNECTRGFEDKKGLGAPVSLAVCGHNSYVVATTAVVADLTVGHDP